MYSKIAARAAASILEYRIAELGFHTSEEAYYVELGVSKVTVYYWSQHNPDGTIVLVTNKLVTDLKRRWSSQRF